jgi:hypothetical protein
MFPESFAEQWIGRLTVPGDTVLDPFCGRGTAPFQALLMNRRAVGIDINPVAYCVTRAKTNAPSLHLALDRLGELEESFAARPLLSAARQLPEFFSVAFQRRTLMCLLHLRNSLKWSSSATDAMIAAITLGILHGESHRSQRYLSNQFPRTISTKPAYSIRWWRSRRLAPPRRNVFELVRQELNQRYLSPIPRRKAIVYQSDMREMPRLLRSYRAPINCVITSPPYFDVTSYEEDQWLRLWFLGGPPQPQRGRISKDDRHESAEGYWGMIADFWRALGQVVESKANVVIRVGSRRMAPEDLVQAVKAASVLARRRVRLVDVKTSELVGRQTHAFRPGAIGCSQEVDCHFVVY